jgi:hypothetical protein
MEVWRRCPIFISLGFLLPRINPLAKIMVGLSQTLRAWQGMGAPFPVGKGGNYCLMECMAWKEE